MSDREEPVTQEATPQPQPQTPNQQHQQLNSKSSISIALAVVIVGGIAYNMDFLSNIRERMTRIEVSSESHSSTLRRMETALAEIKAGFTSQLLVLQGDLREVRAENAMLRERLGKVETVLEKK